MNILIALLLTGGVLALLVAWIEDQEEKDEG